MYVAEKFADDWCVFDYCRVSQFNVYDNISVMCTQDVVEAVHKARFAAGWLQRNASLFHDRFDIPAVAGMSDDLAQQWDARALDSEAITDERNYEIAGGARRELQTQKFNRPNLLPLTSDVVKLTTYLKDTVAENLAVV